VDKDPPRERGVSCLYGDRNIRWNSGEKKRLHSRTVNTTMEDKRGMQGSTEGGVHGGGERNGAFCRRPMNKLFFGGGGGGGDSKAIVSRSGRKPGEQNECTRETYKTFKERTRFKEETVKKNGGDLNWGGQRKFFLHRGSGCEN